MLWERRASDFRTHHTAASVVAGLAVTHPDLLVTVLPSKAWQASAGVVTLACVHTRGPVGTGFMTGAVVQVCKQKYRVEGGVETSNRFALS